MAVATNRTLTSVANIGELYDFLVVDLADPRTNDWFLIRDPAPVFTLLGCWLFFVLSLGPGYMKNKQPFTMQTLLVVYNAFQVAISVWLVYEGLDAAWLNKYSWRCEPVDFSTTPEALRVARGVYVYFLAKLSELFDTVFFVLRKRDRQITFLHMYHHTVMPIITWGATKYYPGGHGTFVGVINSFVHIVMYFYYMMAAMGPQYQKYLWWKRYITTLQMIQFLLAFLHTAQLLFYDCAYPKISLVFILPNAIFFFYLFNDFYEKSYDKNTSVKKAVKPEGEKNKKEGKQQEGEMAAAEKKRKEEKKES